MFMPIDPVLCADMGCRYFKNEVCANENGCAFPEEFGLYDEPPRDREIFASDELSGLSQTEE